MACWNEKHRQAISKSIKNWWKQGRHWSEEKELERRGKISKARKGHKTSEETRLKIGRKNKGKVRSKELREMVSKKLQGRSFSKARKEKHKQNVLRGSKHPRWTGTSKFGYSSEFLSLIRKLIRERDNFICRLCKNPEDGRALDVHHIDYNRKNDSQNNLISLCLRCHRKTNFKRDYWKNYFEGRLMGDLDW